ncbi:MAG: SDR family NAD(P)-dependent oxidoreductase [Rivularia sp. (in: cyanobacteria)]
MNQTFAGQKLIVVGGTSGIGKSIAQLVVQGGGTVVLLGKQEDKLQMAIAQLSLLGGTVFGERADITNVEERNTLMS